MKKTWICSILCILLVIMGVQGCGNHLAQQENVDYTYISLFCDVDFWTPPRWDTSEDTITGKITKGTGVVLETEVPPQDADNRVRLMLANNNLTDLVCVTNATTISQLASSGKFWDLEEFFQKYLPEAKLLKNFPEDVKQGLIKRDGKWYAFPSHLAIGEVMELWEPSSECYQDMVEYATNSGIIWNKKLLLELGLQVEDLRTQEQLLQVFEKAVQANIGSKEPIIPLMLDGQNYWDHSLQFFMETFGAEYVDEDGNYMDIMRQPEAKEALSYLNQMVQNGYFQAEWLTLSNAKIRQMIAEGTVLCFVGNTANIDIDPKEWVTSGPILPSSGEHPVYGREREVGLGWMNTFISKTCEHPVELARFLDYMTSPEGMFQWEFGEEGVHFELQDHLVKLTEEGKRAKRDYGNTGVGAWWMFHNTAWERSILAPYEEGSEEEAETLIKVTYGKAKETRQYNSSLLAMSLGKRGENLEAELQDYKKKQILKVILAENNVQFEQEYQIMMDRLNEMGICELDIQKNIQYQENCREQDDRIPKVN